MKKILYHSFYPNDSSAYYRATGVFPFIKNSELFIKRLQTGYTEIGFSDFLGIDVLFTNRPSDPSHLSFLKLAKDCGVKVVIDYDDDSLHLTQDNPMYPHYEAAKRDIIECLILADEIWVSTPAIKKAYKIYNRNIHVIPNAHNDYLYRVEDKKAFNPNTKVALYRGGMSHQGDVNAYADEIVRVVNANKDWTFYFLGDRFHYMEQRCGDNYVSLAGSTTIQYHKHIQKLNPNIFFYPLRDTVFNRSKSACSWLEASYSGAAYLGNTTLPEFNLKNLVYDFKEFELWFHNDIYYEQGLMETANELSWNYICENLLLSKINKLREERLLAI